MMGSRPASPGSPGGLGRSLGAGRAARPSAPGLAPGSGFEEREPWELGFSAYYDQWVRPELARLERLAAVAQRRDRWRARLLLAAGVLLVMLVAEASASVPITLLWAALLAIIGGGLAQSSRDTSRDRALAVLRDRVIGFFGLRPMPIHRRLETQMKACGLWRSQARLTWAEQYWGLYQGTPVHWARLRWGPGPVGKQAPETEAPSPGVSQVQAHGQPDAGTHALVLLVRTAVSRSSQMEGQGLGREGCEAATSGQAAGALGLGGQPEGPAVAAGLDALSDALAGAPLDVAWDGDGVLVLAHGDLPGFDWRRLAEGSGLPDAAEIQRLTRPLLASLHRLLSAATLLAKDGAGRGAGHPASALRSERPGGGSAPPA